MAATIVLTSASIANAPSKLGTPPDFGTLYSGRALDFDGVSDYIENTNPSGLPSGDTFTVSAWVKDGGGSDHFCVWRRDNATNNPIVRLASDTRKPEIRLLGVSTITADTALTANVWHYVVVSVDNLAVTLYLDGVQDGTGTFASSFSHANEWNTGKYTAGSVHYSNGKLANLQVWDAAWSASDVQYAYTHPEKFAYDTPGTSLTSSNLNLWLPCTEGNPRSPQTSVYDGSGEGNHGTTTFYGVMSDLLNSDQKAFFADILDSTDDAFDFGGNNADAGTTLIDVGDDPDHGFAASNATFAVSSGAGKVTNGAGGTQGKVSLGIATVAGRSYQVLVDCTGTGGSDIAIGLSVDTDYNASHTTGYIGSSTNNALGTAFVATGTTSYLILQMNTSTNAHHADVDNLKVWEVGVAAGWTTADAEPLIPQTALMGMSKPMWFDGVDQYVDLGSQGASSASLQTISAWINIENFRDTTPVVITWGKTELEMTSSIIKYYPNIATGTKLQVTYSLTKNKLYHIVVVRDGDDEGHLYLNGALIETDTSLAAIDTTSAASYIGKYGTQYFDGFINEVSVWDVAFTLAQVQELFNDGVALSALEHSVYTATAGSLDGYWRNDGLATWSDRQTAVTANPGTPTNATESILLPEGTTAGKDILGFPLTHPNNGWLNLSGAEYVDIADNDVVTIVYDFSIECWFKTSTTSTDQGLVGKGTAGSNLGYFLMVLSDNKVRFSVDQSDGTPEQADSGSTLTDGDWHHVVGVYNAGTNVQLYIDNGSPVTETATIESSALDDAGSFLIGDLQDGDKKLYGSIDEVRLYNRALSATEIAKNYKHGKSKHS